MATRGQVELEGVSNLRRRKGVQRDALACRTWDRRRQFRPAKPKTGYNMTTVRITLRELRPGDVIACTGEIVRSVDSFSSLTVVDFENNTATAPLPSNAQTEVIRN